MALLALTAGAAGTLRDDTRRPPYAQAAAFINDHARPGDVVVELQVFPRIPPGRALQVHLDPAIAWYPVRDEQRALDAAGTTGRILYVSPGVRSLEGIRPEAIEAARDGVEPRSWDGLYDVQVVVYAPPHGARGGA